MSYLIEKLTNLSFKLVLFLTIYCAIGGFTTNTFAVGILDFSHRDIRPQGNLWLAQRPQRPPRDLQFDVNRNCYKFHTAPYNDIVFEFIGKGDFYLICDEIPSMPKIHCYVLDERGRQKSVSLEFIKSTCSLHLKKEDIPRSKKNTISLHLKRHYNLWVKTAKVTNIPTCDIIFSEKLAKPGTSIPAKEGDISCSKLSSKNWEYLPQEDACLLRPGYQLHFCFHNKYNFHLIAKTMLPFDPSAKVRIYDTSKKYPSSIFSLTKNYKTIFFKCHSKNIKLVCDKPILIQQVFGTIPEKPSQNKNSISRYIL